MKILSTTMLCTLLAVAIAETPVSAQTTLPDFSAATFSNPLIIDNLYHPLTVGQIREYHVEETDPETGEVETERVVVATLDEIKNVAGIQARVVRDRVYNSDEQIIEDTFDWFAQDDAGNVWYMGETVTDYHYDNEGNLTGTSNPGEWEAGIDGAKPGILMPATVTVGEKLYQEFYQGEAEDEVEFLAVGLEHTIAPFGNYSGVFADVVQTFDSTALDPESLEHKFYAPGIGKIATHSLVDGKSIGGEQLRLFVVPEPNVAVNAFLPVGLLILTMLRRPRHVATSCG